VPIVAADRPTGRTSAVHLDDLVLDPTTGVRRPAGAHTAPADERLEAFVASLSDRGPFSVELRNGIADRPAMTHLSPYRAVIADCFDFRSGLRALELGAGAGALTRWLGERYDEVVAVERDGRLARVAALRTRDLAGVRVHEADPATVESGGGFDLVVVAPGLGEPIDLAALVARAAAALATDGVLLLAVPNRLAFKYWSGAREERSGAPYVALHGHPGSPATTHSARALEEALAAAGFAGADWYLPYPDHLVTRTVVNAGRATPEHGLHNWIETPFADRLAERPAVPLVEGLALREVARAGLLREYANAFLVLAWTGERDAALRHVGADDGWIAKHYSADRAAAFGKRATLTEDGGDLVVANTPLQPGAERVGDAALEHRFTREPFRRGELASLRVLEMIADGTFEGRFGLLLEELHAHLVDRHGLGRTDAEGVPLLRGDAIDVALWNVVSGEDGTWETIDGEWAFAGPLPADFVLFRGLLYLAGRVAPYLGHKPIYRDPNAFAVRWTRHLYPRFSEGRFRAFHQVEAWFQVAAGALPAARGRTAVRTRSTRCSRRPRRRAPSRPSRSPRSSWRSRRCSSRISARCAPATRRRSRSTRPAGTSPSWSPASCR
jgi:SAM-dependent methyltransferase